MISSWTFFWLFNRWQGNRVMFWRILVISLVIPTTLASIFLYSPYSQCLTLPQSLSVWAYSLKLRQNIGDERFFYKQEASNREEIVPLSRSVSLLVCETHWQKRRHISCSNVLYCLWFTYFLCTNLYSKLEVRKLLPTEQSPLTAYFFKGFIGT